jgi:hypothetical protein
MTRKRLELIAGWRAVEVEIALSGILSPVEHIAVILSGYVSIMI